MEPSIDAGGTMTPFSYFVAVWFGGSFTTIAAWVAYVYIRDWILRARRERRLRELRWDIAEAKGRRALAAKGLLKPTQSSKIRLIDRRISDLICEQLHLEAVLGKGA